MHIADHPNPRSLLIRGKTPEFEPLLYCGFYNKYAIYHEHNCDDYSPIGPYDGYPSDAPSTDWRMVFLNFDDTDKDDSLVWLACTKAKMLQRL